METVTSTFVEIEIIFDFKYHLLVRPTDGQQRTWRENVDWPQGTPPDTLTVRFKATRAQLDAAHIGSIDTLANGRRAVVIDTRGQLDLACAYMAILDYITYHLRNQDGVLSERMVRTGSHARVDLNDWDVRATLEVLAETHLRRRQEADRAIAAWALGLPASDEIRKAADDRYDVRNPLIQRIAESIRKRCQFDTVLLISDAFSIVRRDNPKPLAVRARRHVHGVVLSTAKVYPVRLSDSTVCRVLDEWPYMDSGQDRKFTAIAVRVDIDTYDPVFIILPLERPPAPPRRASKTISTARRTDENPVSSVPVD